MGFYSEENCQTEAHEPLLDWASGRKAPVLLGKSPMSMHMKAKIGHSQKGDLDGGEIK